MLAINYLNSIRSENIALMMRHSNMTNSYLIIQIFQSAYLELPSHFQMVPITFVIVFANIR